MCIVSALCQSSDEANKTPPVPQEVSVNMDVLARRRAMSWQRGKIKEILTKGKKKETKSPKQVGR